jgi:predicted Zn finger-like uncharacterized protein
MIIECEKCGTKFEFDEFLLKDKGSRVRCSVCKNIFLAYSPKALREKHPAFPESSEINEVSITPPDSTFLSDDEDQTRVIKNDTQTTEDVQGVASSEYSEEKQRETEDADADQKAETEEPKDEETTTEKDVLKNEVEKDHASDDEDTTSEEDPAVSTKKKSPVTRFFLILLIITFVLIGTAAIIWFFAPQIIPNTLRTSPKTEKQEQSDPGVSRIAFESVTGVFVDSINAGRLFVIKGTVRNNYNKPRSFIRVKGTVLNDDNQIVKEKKAFSGNTFGEKELALLSMEEIDKAAVNQYGKNRKNLNIAPSGTVDFMVVFDDLPDNLNEFTVEAVSSSPGTE